jgi:hypothetical protein
MAPEQLDGGDLDARADAFAFGVTLWEALYGQRPFAGRTAAELRAAIAAGGSAPAAVGVRGRVATPVRRALRGLVADDPAARLPLAAALAALAPPGRGRARLAIAGVAALACGAVATWMAVGAAARPADDPCARGAARARAAWTPLMATSLRGAMAGARAGDAALAAGAVDKLDARAAQLVTAHGAACRAQPTPPVLACLAARQVELVRGGRRADRAAGTSPATPPTRSRSRSPTRACATRPGRRRSSRAGRAPPGQRRAVADARIAAIAAEALRDDARFTEARAAAAALAPRSRPRAGRRSRPSTCTCAAGIETIGGDAMPGHAS